MKIITRKEFLNTPRNTLWSYYEPCFFRELNVKTSNKDDNDFDFVYFGLIGEFDLGVHDYSDVCQEMENGLSIPLSLEETTREGLFDDEQLFLVYEKEDIQKLADLFNNLLK